MYFSSQRRFKLWDYSVSHKQLLLRSPYDLVVRDNVDIVFWQVEYIAVPTLLDGVSLNDSSDAERELIESVVGTKLPSPVYRIDSGERSYFVAAGGFKVLSNNNYDSTLVDFGLDRPREWYGVVVAHS